LFVLCVEMANSANTNTVVRTWFGGRRGLLSGGSNGRTGRGRGRRRLRGPRLPRRRDCRRFPPRVDGRTDGRAVGGGRRGLAAAGGRGSGGTGAGAGRAGPRRRLGPGGRAAPALAAGARPGGRKVAAAAPLGARLRALAEAPERPWNKSRARGVGRIPRKAVANLGFTLGTVSGGCALEISHWGHFMLFTKRTKVEKHLSRFLPKG
jgi:hypothetical protein